jgi:hypothetical protein
MGFQGIKGNTGPTGKDGPTGADGLIGPTGPAGSGGSTASTSLPFLHITTTGGINALTTNLNVTSAPNRDLNFVSDRNISFYCNNIGSNFLLDNCNVFQQLGNITTNKMIVNTLEGYTTSTSQLNIFGQTGTKINLQTNNDDIIIKSGKDITLFANNNIKLQGQTGNSININTDENLNINVPGKQLIINTSAILANSLIQTNIFNATSTIITPNLSSGSTFTNLNFLSPIKLQNPYTTIATNTPFNGYSSDVFTLDWTGSVLFAPVQYLTGYTRIGNMVFIDIGPQTFIKKLSGTASILTSADPIPFDLRDTEEFYNSYTTINMSQDGVNSTGNIWLDVTTGKLNLALAGDLPFTPTNGTITIKGCRMMIAL